MKKINTSILYLFFLSSIFSCENFKIQHNETTNFQWTWDQNFFALEDRLLLTANSYQDSFQINRYLHYVDSLKRIAAIEMIHRDIPVSITLAQGLLESNAGQSWLARKCNNNFGIKCHDPPYKVASVASNQEFIPTELSCGCRQMKDDHIWDRFNTYCDDDNLPAVVKSFIAHSLLLNKSRYAWMIGKYEVGQTYHLPNKWYKNTELPYYACWAIGLKKSGYATDPNYPIKLIDIIEDYQLWRFDHDIKNLI